MDLILWRHADAVDDDPAGDLARRLTPRGERQAERMAAWLDARLPPATRVLVSPATRCRQTATALDRAFTTVAEIAPGMPPEHVHAAAGWPAANDAVLVVGHQPTLGLAASLALGATASYRAVPKAGVVWLRRHDGGRVELVVEQSPDGLSTTRS